MNLSDAQLRDWLRLSLSENVGPATFRTLINRFGGASQALEALPEISLSGGIRRPLRICSKQDAENILARAAALDARFIAYGEPDFSPLLPHADGTPPLLCVKGSIDCAARPTVSIVGARNASALGLKFTRQIARELGAAGYTIVSGLARGIDTAAHEASSQTGTIAVLAGGIDNIYPPENADLYQQIIDHGGAIVTEMMPGTKPQPKYFPRRNRIISGLSYGTVVIEVAQRSGSLITARLANEQGRTVFAVPGSPRDPRAAGTNKLIRQGGVLTTCSDDVLRHLAPMLEPPFPSLGPSAEEPERTDFEYQDDVPNSVREMIVSLLGPAPVSIDDLIRESGAPAALVLTVLLELDLAGRLQRHGAQSVSAA
jgi:DNA processing protein